MKISFTNEDEIKTFSDKQKQIRHQETRIKGRRKLDIQEQKRNK